MQQIIVSDTSCLILLKKINRLDLLYELFGQITITEIIADEFGSELTEYIRIENLPIAPIKKSSKVL
jgi:predicted nucleic acid-binding protein